MVAPSFDFQAALGERYAIQRELGHGGMGVVYLATDRKHDRLVAIKVLRPEVAGALGSERFLREIQIAARLSHPHIVPLFDSGTADGLLFYVMPFVEGESLQEKLAREGRLGLADALRIAREIASALAYSHGHGVVHRDIKPANILLSGREAMVVDFGVARAISEAAAVDLTASGILPGTPSYMSPEQASDQRDIDGRTDVYGLGCVLYEMLTGEPPFTGRTSMAVLAKHVHEPAPSVRTLRADVPVRIDSIIHKALAKSPADRFATAQEFAETLQAVEGSSAAFGRTYKNRRWAIAAVTPAAVAAVAYVMTSRPRGLDESSYLLATITEGNAAEPPQWPIRETQWALRRVPHVKPVDPTIESDLLEREGKPGDPGAWLARARKLRAGRLILLTIWPEGARASDSISLSWSLYETRNGQQNHEHPARAPNSPPDGATLAATAVEALFDLEPGVIGRAASRNDAAVREFVAGTQAERQWDLERARSHYQAAVDRDTSFVRANFRLAQVLAWQNQATVYWSSLVARALSGAEQLDRRESLLARALLATSAREFPTACLMYDSLIDANANDFAAWLGLGRCHGRDFVVVRDPASPSKWSFRGSQHAAAEAYYRAFRIQPAFLFTFGRDIVGRLAELLYANRASVRRGRPLSPDTGAFAAYVSLSDTLEFVPQPEAEVATGRAPHPAGHQNAIEHNRRRLQQVVQQFATRFPDSTKALIARAEMLELIGTLDSKDRNASALHWARTAVEVAHTPQERVYATIVEVRLLLKLYRFGEARKKAASVTRDWLRTRSVESLEIAPLAALVGDANLLADLMEQGAPKQFEGGNFAGVWLPVLETRERLLAYALIGAPADSIRALAERLPHLASARLFLQVLNAWRCQLLETPLEIAFPVLEKATEEQSCLAGAYRREMQWALSQGQLERVSTIMDRVDAVREGDPAGDLAIDWVFHEAWLLAEAGDTVRAQRHLERSLNALPTMSVHLVGQASQAAALVRAMALFADLHAARGNSSAARQWATGAAELWRDSDIPEIQQIVSRMNGMARR